MEGDSLVLVVQNVRTDHDGVAGEEMVVYVEIAGTAYDQSQALFLPADDATGYSSSRVDLISIPVGHHIVDWKAKVTQDLGEYTIYKSRSNLYLAVFRDDNWNKNTFNELQSA